MAVDIDAVVEAMVDRVETIADRVARDVWDENTRELAGRLDAWADEVNQVIEQVAAVIGDLGGRVAELEQQAQDKTSVPIAPPGMDLTDEQLVAEIIRRGVTMSTIAKARAAQRDDSDSDDEDGSGVEGGDGAGSAD